MKLNPRKNVPAAQMGVFLCGEEEQMLQAGDTVQIDANVPHTFTSIEEDAEWLEFFTPVREDFLP